MDRDSTLTALADIAADLCDGRQHVERVPYWDRNRNRKTREWRTLQPGLLAQLYTSAVEPVRGLTDGVGTSTMGSRPPLALEALSTHAAITCHVTRWCWSLRLDIRDTLEADIRALVGAAPSLDSDTTAALLSEMRQWHRWASVATGWQAPLYSPHVPCPACETTGKLRVNLHTQTAHCRGCQTTWASDDGSIYLLAETIRTTHDTAA